MQLVDVEKSERVKSVGQWQRFEELVVQYMAKENIPGLSIAAARDGKVIYEKGFGQANIENKIKTTPNTIYGIASITKSFTALIIMRLVEVGKLTVEDSVIKHLPNFELKDYEDIEAITIHHILSHTSGIPTIKRKESLRTFDAHLHYLKEVDIQPIGKPGDYFCYNNDLYLLLGAIIEKVTGKPYQEVIHKEIIIPNGMNRTTFDLKEVERWTDVSTPYQLEGEELVECAWPRLGNYAVGGGIRSTVLDLLKYGALYLENAYGMSEGVHPTNGTTEYGYGLQVTPNYTGKTLVEHGGSQPGVSSNFGYIPEENLVVAVLANVNGASAANIWLHAVNAACKVPLQQARHIEPHYYLTEQEKSKFIGKFVTGEGTEIKIVTAIGELQATIDGKDYMLRASNIRTLVVQELERPMRFYFDDHNQVWGLFYGMRMYLKEEDVG